MWQHGNRTIYTAEAGKLADMVRSPIDREEKVGPVCGRLALFFNNTTQSFDLSQMMLHLGDEKLDTLAPSPKFEDGNGGKAFGKSLHYYKARIGADPDIRKRDSVVFVCGRK
jgi:hypothetical protein